ncbi:hypothetical protein [Tellurirhabdus bombi]|uniref:hypothetical protein n=1 Tax=Tellurirhabdus bombi TaxID=2907205 RepID=UPI001F2CCDCB|nr:hypothetical protein [Tellurirhabdus bombi]
MKANLLLLLANVPGLLIGGIAKVWNWLWNPLTIRPIVLITAIGWGLGWYFYSHRTQEDSESNAAILNKKIIQLEDSLAIYSQDYYELKTDKRNLEKQNRFYAYQNDSLRQASQTYYRMVEAFSDPALQSQLDWLYNSRSR